jgi:uncharacterized protein YfdQ (DUF2303 family)
MDEKAIKALVHAIAPTPITIHKFDEEHQVATGPGEVRFVNLKEFLPPPNRVKQRVTLLNVPSFVEYVNRFATAATTVFANETTGNYDASLDFHDPGTRGTLEHSAAYACPQSEQWKAWVGDNGEWFEQIEFSEFLEQNLREIIEPPGAVFMQVALELQVHKSAQFASDVRLDNGQTKFRYEETVRGSTKAGDIEIPSEFTLRLPVFVDGKSHELKARFRYRMVEGKLTLGYQLIRHMDVWNIAVKAVTEEVRQGVSAKGVHLYTGTRG